MDRYTEKFDYRTIETFEDACERLGLDPSNLPNLSTLPKRLKKPLIAFYKLMVVFESINDKWLPDYNNKNQCKYYPLFEIDPSGTGFFDCKNSSVFNNTKTNSFLCCNTQDKALYAGKQFIELWKDYYLINRSQPDPSQDNDPSKRNVRFRIMFHK